MAYKKVEKYDKNDTLVYTFSSVKECIDEDGISRYLIHRRCDKNNLYNGFYYNIIDYKPYYVKRTCDWCGKEFDCQRFRTEKGRNHLFCSIKCKAEFDRAQTPLNCTCSVCGKKYHMKQSHIDKYGSKYCSIECHKKAKEQYMKGELNHQYGLKGDKNASWKSDERISYYGYKLIRQLDHPFANCDGFVFEHRLVAEKYLLNDENCVIIDGIKYLSPDFIVHHIDFDRLNNSKDNLIVMSESEHAKIHRKLKDERYLKEYCERFDLDIKDVKNKMENAPKYHKKQ